MAKMIPLDPAVSIPCAPADLIATEAGRGEKGLTATVQIYNGDLKGFRLVRFAVEKDCKLFATTAAECTGVGEGEVLAALPLLANAIETRLRERKGKRRAEEARSTGDLGSGHVSGGEGRFGRPRILLEERDLHALTIETWRAIEKANRIDDGPTLFRHGGTIARIEPDEAGGVRTEVLRLDTMRRELVRMVEFEKEENGDIVPARPPSDLVANLLAWPEPPLPVLLRLVHVPVFDASGRLLATEGYDSSSRLHLSLRGLVIPPLPDEPSEEQLRQAREIILVELLGDFPFARQADIANAVAIIIVPFVRALILGPTPLHMIEKPSPGTGAGLLTEVLAIPALGRSPSLMTEGRDEDEWRKRITAVLSRVPAFVVIDNLRQTLDSAALSAALTAPVWEDRILGHSRTVSLQVHCVWIATGNNPGVSHEIARRSVPIRLDAKLDQPWKRPREGFRHPDLRQWAMEHRGDLVWAALVMVRAWLSAERPRGKGIALGSYEGYSQILGGILAHAGIPGFLENLSDFYDRADREGEAWRGLVGAWWAKYQISEVGTSEVWDLIQEGEHDLHLGHGTEQARKTRLGILLRQARDRRYQVLVDGKPTQLRLEHLGQKQRSARYRLVPESEGGEAPTSTPGRESEMSSEPGEGGEPFPLVLPRAEEIQPPSSASEGKNTSSSVSELGGEGSQGSPGSQLAGQGDQGETPLSRPGSVGEGSPGSRGSLSGTTPPSGEGTEVREVFEV